MDTLLYKYQRPLLGFLAIVGFIALWEILLTWVFTLDRFFISKPSLIASGFMALVEEGKLQSDLAVSAEPFLYGFTAAVIVGIAVGVVMGRERRVGLALDPLMTALYASPLVAVAPLIIIYFGVGVTAKAVLIFILAVFPFIFNAYAGVRAIDRLLINVVRSLGGRERDIYLKVIVPSVLPFIVAGARIAIGRGLVGIIVGEFFAAAAGVGYSIQFFGDLYALDRMFAYIFVMMVIAVILTEGVRWAERRAFPWKVER